MSMTTPDWRSLSEKPADEINRLNSEILAAGGEMLNKALRIGELLVQQKATLPHGQFGPWCERHVPEVTDRTCRNYMRLYRERDRLKTEKVSDLSAAYKLLVGDAQGPSESPAPAEADRFVPNDGPLPEPGEKLLGSWRGVMLELTTAENPEYVFIEAAFIETGTDDDGQSVFTKRPIRRKYVHAYVRSMVQVHGDYHAVQATWDEPEACATPVGSYFPGYVPAWKKPSWAEIAKQRRAEADRDAQLVEWAMAANGLRIDEDSR